MKMTNWQSSSLSPFWWPILLRETQSKEHSSHVQKQNSIDLSMQSHLLSPRTCPGVPRDSLLTSETLGDGCTNRSSSDVAQQKRTRLVSMRIQVRSLASLSGLRIWCCCELWYSSQIWLGSGVAVAVVQANSCSLDKMPILGTSICCRCGPKKPKKTKQKKLLLNACNKPIKLGHIERKKEREGGRNHISHGKILFSSNKTCHSNLFLKTQFWEFPLWLSG